MMSSPTFSNFKSEVERVFQRRDELVRLCYDTPGVEPDDLLTAEIVSINQTVVPSLRGQILAASNIAKGEEKHQLLELLGQIDGAMSGIGTYHDLDVSEARLDSLRRKQAVTRSHREGKQLAKEIRAIERARSQWKTQQQLLLQAASDRDKTDAEVRTLDEILYGQHPKPE